MRHTKKYRTAILHTSIKTILASAGVPVHQLPAIESALVPEWEPPEQVVIPNVPKRFKRTKKEMEELRAFNKWQIDRRNLVLDK